MVAAGISIFRGLIERMMVKRDEDEVEEEVENTWLVTNESDVR